VIAETANPWRSRETPFLGDEGTEKKELLWYAKAMSDEAMISGDKCVIAENGHMKPCKRVLI
jgi:hypothetical protein